MSWALFMVISYLGVGVIITTCASIGYRMRLGYKMPWLYWLAGVFLWSIILLIGGKGDA